jgi:phospholipid N-methyltransferase
MSLSPTPRPADVLPASPDWLLMLRKFVRHGTAYATFVPSSRFVARSICRGIDFETAKCIVELGAGTGPITREVLSHRKPHTRVVVVEIDPDFCKRLRERFPTADVVEGDARHIDKLLADRGIASVDHVISGLPLPSFPAPLRDAIVASSAKALAPGGTFRQLTNMPWVYQGLYKSYFDEVEFRLVVRNFPPAGSYICRGYKVKPTA